MPPSQLLQSFLFLFIDIAAIALGKTKAKPNTKIQRSPLFVATNVRKPPLLPCPVRATRLSTHTAIRVQEKRPSCEISDSEVLLAHRLLI
jgi:hypothetical protein